VEKVDTHCQIGKVTLKGGAELRIFEGGKERESRELAEQFCDAANEVAETYGGDTGGFVIIHWNSEGQWISRFATGRAAGIHLNILPEWVAGALRREIAENDLRRSQSGETGE
jgi:hypothetical protein